MAIDRRLLHNLDWVLLGCLLTLSTISIAMVASATHRPPKAELARSIQDGSEGVTARGGDTDGRFATFWARQAIWIAAGLFLLVLAVSFDYRRLADRTPWLYLATLGVLVLILLVGPRIAGTRRWFTLGPFQAQPSELAKVVAAFVLARAFADSRKETLSVRDALGPGVAIGVMALLIAVEPDLGTAFCLVPMFFAVCFVAGMQARALIGLFVSLALAGSLVGWVFAKDYQKRRILSYAARYVTADGWIGQRVGRFVSIDRRAADERGAGYQSLQSRIAVGSGGLFGRGYRKGGQNQLGYLPARHTDFILSVIAEELGFVGMLTVLGIYLLVLWRGLETAHEARDRLGALLVSGLCAVLAFQLVYNAAMIAGLVPVKGLPVPFMSYGGSSTLSAFIMIGLILNVRMRRFAN
jgi:rod shape determining protein RodA